MIVRKTSALSMLAVRDAAHPSVEAPLQTFRAPMRGLRSWRAVIVLASLGALAAIAPASGGQSRTEKAATTSQKSHRADEAAMLRKKLDALEQILVQNQQENARLRQQLKALQAQQSRQSKAMEAQRSQQLLKAQEAQQNAAAAMSREAAVAAEQAAATRKILRDLQIQQDLLKTQTQQADALYRNGMTTYQDAVRKRADADINRARIAAAEAQLKELQNGRPSSIKDQLLAQLHEQIAEQKAELVQGQEGLRIAQERFKAGVATNSEVVDAELKISRTQAAIDQLNAQILQAGGR